MEKMTRKDFFKTATKYAAGATVGAAIVDVVATNSASAETAAVDWP